MKAVRPLDANVVYKAPVGAPDVLDLHCTRVKPGLIRTEWRLSQDELEYLQAGGSVELEIHGEPIAPIALNVTEPFCPECVVKMALEWAEVEQVELGGAKVLNRGDEQRHRPAHWHFRCPSCRRWA